MKTIVLGLGNELLSDDGIGIQAVRYLRQAIEAKVDIVESPVSGLALLDVLMGYDKAIIIDSILLEGGKPGQIYEINLQDLGRAKAPSGHYAGLPELLKLSESYDIDFPQTVKIFAVEVEDPYTLRESISAKVQEAISDLVELVKSEIS